ncbi:MAG: 23S rRNA (adenine(2503)-C(2))-methyltransferase RlmN [Magnetococcus sp. WYHC-3]
MTEQSELPAGETPGALVPLAGLERMELENLLVSWGEKPFRARQIWSWIHVRLAADVAAMSDLSRPLRALLQERCAPLRPDVVAHRISVDGTEKWLLRLTDGQQIETVFIPESDRGTLCLSTQVGCTLSCPFCHTGAQGFSRNLGSHEIVEQVLLAREALGRRGQRVTNVVLMGMGEPLYNYAQVARAVRILLDETGLAIGTRKITLSTAGLVPRMEQAGRELGVNLAISLHAVRDEVRDELVPLNRKYNLATLGQAARDYPLKSGRRITWEYVLLDGVNDSAADARLLVQFLRGIPSKVNLLPFNPWPGTPYRPASAPAMARFQKVLWDAQLVAVVRESRGADIAAACGQLKGELLGARPRQPRDSGRPLLDLE